MVIWIYRDFDTWVEGNLLEVGMVIQEFLGWCGFGGMERGLGSGLWAKGKL